MEKISKVTSQWKVKDIKLTYRIYIYIYIFLPSSLKKWLESILTLMQVHQNKRTFLFLICWFSFIWIALVFTNSSHEPYLPYLSGSTTFKMHKESPRVSKTIWMHQKRGETHFLVLAQTFMYAVIVLTIQCVVCSVQEVDSTFLKF